MRIRSTATPDACAVDKRLSSQNGAKRSKSTGNTTEFDFKHAIIEEGYFQTLNLVLMQTWGV